LKARPLSTLCVLLFAVFILAACSSIQPAAIDDPGQARRYQARFDHLNGIDAWSLEGRLAVSNENDGGSGHFNWSKQGRSDRMNFHGALGRGAWRLAADENGAELELADGSVYRAVSINELVRNRVGWEIPLEHLAWWVRGLAAPGGFEQRLLDAEGNLVELRQAGWKIEFGRYKTFGGIGLPVKMTARREASKVKLAIRNWSLGKEGGSSG
jgi:outer membrane lipoprotein LolB